MRGRASNVERGRIGRRRHRRDVEHRHRRFRQIGKIAGAGERVLAPRDRLLALGAHGRDLALDQSLLERRPGAAGLLDLLEQRPGRAAELLGQILDARRSRRPDRHLGEVRFLEQHELRVARDPAREPVGQAERQGERQHA